MVARSTWVLLALALLLGGYVWWFEIRGKERQAEADEAARRLVELDVAELSAIELRTADERDARLERDTDSGADWRLVAPVDWPVDDFTVERLLEALEELASTSTIDPAPEDLAPFGLHDAARRLRAHAGDASVEIALGKRAPVGAARYVQVSTRPGQIFAVAFADTTALEPDLVDLRDKRITTADPEDVAALVVRLADGVEIRVERGDGAAPDGQGHPAAAPGGGGDGDGGGGAADVAGPDGAWHLTAPIRAPADGERIERVIDDLELARASDFIDAPVSPAEHGLNPPLAVVELELRGSAAAVPGTAELELGVPGTGSAVSPGARRVVRLELGRTEDAAWVRRPGETAILQVRERLVDGLPREVFEYRHKRVLTLDASEVAEVELAFPREEIRYRFVREGDRWSPADDALQVDSLEVADLVFAIEELDATAVEPDATPLAELGLDPPRARVTALNAAGAEVGWLELGDPHPDRGLAARSSASDTLWRVRNELGEDVPLSLDAFRNDFAEATPEE